MMQNDAEPFGIFLILLKFICLLVSQVSQPMCHKYHTEYCDDFQQQLDCKFL